MKQFFIALVTIFLRLDEYLSIWEETEQMLKLFDAVMILLTVHGDEDEDGMQTDRVLSIVCSSMEG